MDKVIRIGTRESQLALWQANLVKDLLAGNGYKAELVLVKSEGDTDLKTPLYEMGVQGIFTKTLDIALLNNKIDIAVHSMKDVPTAMAKGIIPAAVLKRASYKDIFVPRGHYTPDFDNAGTVIATSSIRRKAQWLNRYPGHQIENLRGNVNTRLKKVSESNWAGAIFAAAGLERINLRPDNAIDLDWMLPAPAQGAIIVVCRDGDGYFHHACQQFHDSATELCTRIERDFLNELMGGCSMPISALAEIDNGDVHFKGNILSPDGKDKQEIQKVVPVANANGLGRIAAKELLDAGGRSILDAMRNDQK